MMFSARGAILSLFAFSAAVQAQSCSTPIMSSQPPCKCMPTDPCWPTQDQWNSFNTTVRGRLIRSVPLATVCHDPDYDAVACKALQDNWIQPSLHDESSSSIMTPFWANQSCDPFTSRETPCTLGNYVQYAVDIETPDDIRATMKFAREKNIRFVIRNTGHCFLGKSTGAGSLAVWTHHLKGMEFIPNYVSSRYTGGAVKIKSGTQTGEIYDETHKRGLIIVGGECPTVGFAGGFVQGGGHSPFTSKYGLGSDNVLEFEVVTANGDFVTANRGNNSDLFWALAGGGPGTYGVVWSVTVKTYPDTSVTGGIITFSTANMTAFYSAIDFYHTQTPRWTDQGAYSYAFYMKGYFQTWPIFAPGKTADDMNGWVQPFTDKLTELGITYNKTVTTYPTFLEAFNNLYAPITVGGFQFGGRLIPRSVIQDDALRAQLGDAIKLIIEDGASVLDVAIRPSHDTFSGVNPEWRTVEMMILPATLWSETAPWSQMLGDRYKITNIYDAALKAFTPGGGAYLNEADGDEPDWKLAFYGEKYDLLRTIKYKYDSNDFFYAKTAVGSDAWKQMPDGRLCRAWYNP